MGTRVINTVKSSKLHRQIQPSMCLKLRAAIHVVEFQDRIEKAAKLIFRHLYIETVLVLAYLGYCARVNKKKKKGKYLLSVILPSKCDPLRAGSVAHSSLHCRSQQNSLASRSKI